ncbi:MAG: hypothetical protein SFU25_07720 [Candidatus Caenarcaniphilales bacterium]|nr:hypothetical protein [Candidatus Caenarcaniphilales bacterium]
MKFKEFVLTVGVFSLIGGCNQTVVLPKIDQQIKPSHKKLVDGLLETDSSCKVTGPGKTDLVCRKRRIYKRTVKKGQTWHGKWIYTVAKQEAKLKSNAKLYSIMTDPDTGKYVKGKEVPLDKLSADDLLLVGFLSLSDRGDNFLVEPSLANEKTTIEDFKNVRKIIHWVSKKDEKEVVFDASYDPSTDIIYGQIKSDSFQGVFRATRISETSFQNLTGMGVVNPQMPLYVIAD